MSERKDKLRETILADHAASIGIFRRLTPEQWDKPVPSEEDAPWKARDVLAHLAVSEGGQLNVITRLLSEGLTIPDDFDLKRYNRRSVEKKAARTVPELLETIEQGHAKVLAALDALPEADLDKAGKHARGDNLTVERFFHRITEHRREHAEAVAAAVGL